MHSVFCSTDGSSDMLDRMTVKGTGYGSSKCQKDKTILYMKMDTLQTIEVKSVTLIGTGRWNLKCLCISYVKLITNIYISRHVLLVSHLRFRSIYFPLADVFYWGSPWIGINMVYCIMTYENGNQFYC